MQALNSSESQLGADEDTFAHAILDRDALRPKSTSFQAMATQTTETQKQTDEWRTLCRAKGWLCGVCGVYPEYGNSLGYEGGLCPVHRLTSQLE